MRSVKLTTRFVVASNSVSRLMDGSGALAARMLFLPFETSFLGREDVGLKDKLLSDLPGIANWALAGLARLRANCRFALSEGHRRLAGQYAAETAPVLAWVREAMAVSAQCDPGDLPPECVAPGPVSIERGDAYRLFCGWCEGAGVEPASPKWFGRDLSQVLPKMRVVRRPGGDGRRQWWYDGFGARVEG